MNIRYLKGDATKPVNTDTDMNAIIHCCNDIGAWGAGFVVALSRRWKKPEQMYRLWHRSNHRSNDDFKLGNIQVVKIEDNLEVVNMIGQRHTITRNNVPPIRYNAITQCCEKLANYIINSELTYTIHMPRMGCGLAGGSWDEIVQCMEAGFLKITDIDVYVYDYIGGK